MRVNLKGVLAAFVALLAFSGGASASAHEFKVEGVGVTSSVAVTGTGGVMNLTYTLLSRKIDVECTSSSLTGSLGAGGASQGQLTGSTCSKVYDVTGGAHELLSACHSSGLALGFVGSLLGGPATQHWEGLGPEHEVTNLTVSGAECPVKLSRAKITGSQNCELPEAGVEKVEHEMVCKPAGSILHFALEVVTLENTQKVKLTSGKKWSAI